MTGRQSATTVFLAFLKLGLTSFGGPVAHLGFFREALVVRRRWLDDRTYADLVALCQFLPGPASSQVGIGIGLIKAGLPGAFAAWLGFTVPSALAMTLFGYGVVAWAGGMPLGALQGLKIAAVAVVAQALWGMARTLTPDAPRITLAAASAIAVLAAPSPWMQVLVIAGGALFGLIRRDGAGAGEASAFAVSVPATLAVILLGLFTLLLVGLPIAAAVWPGQALALVDSFFRAGSLVFGGGHVVLPLLQAEVVPPGWVTNEAFMAGYGAAQAVPGPLFTFSAYLGAVLETAPTGWTGALVCLLAIFLPSFLLVIGVLPFWSRLRRVDAVRHALAGINAAVVGLLLAALYDPVWTSAVRTTADFALALGAFTLLVFWRTPPWLVVALSAAAGWAMVAAGVAAA